MTKIQVEPSKYFDPFEELVQLQPVNLDHQSK